jgi:general secretion pathway protein H
MTMRIFIANSPRAGRVIRTAPVKKANGFTLVEIMVVVFLIGLASAAVILSLPGDASKLRDQADRLAARIASARDSAVLTSRPIAVWLRPSGYGFEERRDGVWQAASGKSLAQVQWTSGATLALGTAREARVSFDVTGLPSSPLDIKLQQGDANIRVTISAAGEVAVAR